LNAMQTGHLADLPMHEALVATKMLFRDAAALARAELAFGGHGPTKVKLAGTIACIRATRVQDPRALRKAILMAPHLAKFIDHRTFSIKDPAGIRDSLHELMESAICEDLLALDRSCWPRRQPDLRH
jgi:hypothetical protein